VKNQKAISNEGIPVIIEWHSMVLGASFFIPALDTEPLVKAILVEAKQHGMKLKYKEKIENGLFGLRFWRTK
jgi:hypothetical protein